MSVFFKLLGTAALVAGAAYAGKKFINKHNVEVKISPAKEKGCEKNVTFDDEDIPTDEDVVFSEEQASSEYTYTIGKHVKIHVENPVETEDYEDVPETEIQIEFTEEERDASKEDETKEENKAASSDTENAEAAEEL